MSEDKRKDIEREFGQAYNASSMGGELGLKGVRLSPSQYLGSRGVEGALQALLEIIQNSVDESAEMIAFFAKHGIDKSKLGKFKIDIIIRKDDTALVKDTGRGVPADHSDKFNRPVVEVAFEEINVGGKGRGYVEEGKSAYVGKTIGKHGSGAACANATSEYFKVDTFVMKDKKHYQVKWENAEKVQTLKLVGDSGDTHGTMIEFRPSKEVFELYSEKRGHVERFFDMDDIVTILTEYAYNTENIIFDFKFQQSNGTWENKVIDSDTYIPSERLKQYTKSDIKYTQIVNNDLGYQMDVYIGVASIKTQYLTCNMVTLKHGSHLAAVGEALDDLKPEILAEINKRVKAKKLMTADVTQRTLNTLNIGTPLTYTSMYLSLFMDDPDYSGQSKDELRSPRIKEPLKKQFKEALQTTLSEFKDDLVNEIARLAMIHIEREESYRREEERRKAQAEKRKRERELLKEGNPNYIKGLDDSDSDLIRAREQDVSKVILYTVEGLSAKKALVGARDVQTESIYPIIERPPNVFIHEDDALWKMPKFKQMYKTFYGDKNGNYKAIVIATDADADGGLIRMYIIAFLSKFFPHYLAKGKLYEFNTPKHSATKDNPETGEKEVVFLFSDEERRQHYIKTNGSWNYASYKGLGSIPKAYLRKLLDDENSLTRIEPKSLKEGFEEMYRLLTDTKYKQNYVLKHYGSPELFMHMQSRKDVLKHHELDFDVNAIEEQFTYEHSFEDLKTMTFLENILVENNMISPTINKEDEDMLMNNALSDEYDEADLIQIDSDMDSED